MASDNETAEQFCLKVDHDWQATDYGIRCVNCEEIQEVVGRCLNSEVEKKCGQM